MKTLYFTIVFFFAGFMWLSAQPGIPPGSSGDKRLNGPELNKYRKRNSYPFRGGGPVPPTTTYIS